MDFNIKYLSFFVINVDEQEEQSRKSYKMLSTLDEQMYIESALKPFLDGELLKIVKRKVERHPKSDQVPTKLGRFIVELGHDLTSNPNYNLFNRIRQSSNKNDFAQMSIELVKSYLDTSAVRGGVLITLSAKLNQYFDEPFLFVLKCDFEQKVATITDEKTLIHNVQMAITTKNMKSIQYPYMPEEGIVEQAELKIHQSSHSRYFEDFLKYVEYEPSMPQIVKSKVVDIVQQELIENMTDHSEEKEQIETALEIWSTSSKRELIERWSEEQVMEATSQIIEYTPEIELKLKLDHLTVKGLLADFGQNIHIAKINQRYVIMLEGEQITFDKNVSPVELLRPSELTDVLKKMYHSVEK